MNNTYVQFAVLFLIAFVASFFLFRATHQPESNKLLPQSTFCENLVEMKRIVSSRYSSELDTAPDEYYTRGVVSAPIHFGGKYSQAREFETAITESVFSSPGPNFAGHYTVASWSCGSTCHSHAVVDNNTGEIVSFGLQSEYGAGSSLDTKVLILNPKENMPTLEESGMAPGQAAQTFARIPREYYVLSKNEVTDETSLDLFCTESAGAHYTAGL